MGDGDDAGRKMAVDVVEAMRRYSIAPKIIDCPFGRDPADLSQEEVLALLG
jgi:DNA primase